MKCAYCQNEDTKVIETRESSEATRRRRECLTCEKRFTTYERSEIVELFVIKKNGMKVPFDKEKIRTGMFRSCEKRPVTEDQINNAANQIERRLRLRDSVEVSSKEIGRMVLKKLQKLDKVAYIRFASVYREFSDVSSFELELKKIIKAK